MLIFAPNMLFVTRRETPTRTVGSTLLIFRHGLILRKGLENYVQGPSPDLS